MVGTLEPDAAFAQPVDITASGRLSAGKRGRAPLRALPFALHAIESPPRAAKVIPRVRAYPGDLQALPQTPAAKWPGHSGASARSPRHGGPLPTTTTSAPRPSRALHARGHRRNGIANPRLAPRRGIWHSVSAGGCGAHQRPRSPRAARVTAGDSAAVATSNRGVRRQHASKARTVDVARRAPRESMTGG